MRLISPRHVLTAAVFAAFLLIPVSVRAQGAPARLTEPRGFDFTPDGVWRPRSRQVRQQREAAMMRGDFASLNAALRNAASLAQAGAPAPSPMAVSGVLRVPVFLVAYKNSSIPSLHTPAEYDATLLAAVPTLGRPYTVRTFYQEMSNGLLTVQGQVIGWVQLDSNDTWYEGTQNGLTTSGHVAQLIQEAVSKSDVSIDFSQFDNDGPDGIPNSGDDDGEVDVAVFVQPERDGACGGNSNIWSHRFAVTGWGFPAVQTADNTNSSTHPGKVRVNNYTIQSGVGGTTACDANSIMAIGTIAHETGHAFGLPDLYDTNPSDGDDSEGIGHWGLMSSGNYARPLSPAYMEGWSRNQLGWVSIKNLATSGTYRSGPYTVEDTVYQYTPSAPNARNEYFLIENRQRTMSDSALINSKGPGLLIFHVDPIQLTNGNQINSGPIHGLNLLQADGLDNLGSSLVGFRNRGDAGDPFPGSSGNTALSFNTNPSVRLNDGTLPPFRIDSIRYAGTSDSAILFRFTTGGLTIVKGSDTAATIMVQGTMYNVYRDLFNTGDTLTVAADSAQLSGDGRTQYLYSSWSDGGARTHVATMNSAGLTLTAALGRKFRVVYAAVGPGSVTATGGTASATFIDQGDSVTLTAVPSAGASFVGWNGDTATQNTSVKLRMARPYTVTASFQLALAVQDSALGGSIMGTPYQDTIKVVGGTGTHVFALLNGTLPPGLQLTPGGVLIGTPSKDSTFTFTVRVISGQQFLDLPLRLAVTAPTLAAGSVVNQLLLGGSYLTPNDLTYLDLLGNRNGQYDVGDFTAWLDKTGTVVSAAVMQRAMTRSTP